MKKELIEKIQQTQKRILDLKLEVEQKIDELEDLMEKSGIGTTLCVGHRTLIDYKPNVKNFVVYFVDDKKEQKKCIDAVSYKLKGEEADKIISENFGAANPDEIYDLAYNFGFSFAYNEPGWTTSSYDC